MEKKLSAKWTLCTPRAWFILDCLIINTLKVAPRSVPARSSSEKICG